jgi:hypothetical protein
MRVLAVVAVIVVVLALGLWGLTRIVLGVLPNGPIANLLVKHKPIKQIIEHGGLPTLGPPRGSACASSGRSTPTGGPPLPCAGTPGTRGGRPPFAPPTGNGPGPGGRPPGSGPPLP